MSKLTNDYILIKDVQEGRGKGTLNKVGEEEHKRWKIFTGAFGIGRGRRKNKLHKLDSLPVEHLMRSQLGPMCYCFFKFLTYVCI